MYVFVEIIIQFQHRCLGFIQPTGIYMKSADDNFPGRMIVMTHFCMKKLDEIKQKSGKPRIVWMF